MTNNYLDTAQLELSNESNETLYFYRQFVDCFQVNLPPAFDTGERKIPD